MANVISNSALNCHHQQLRKAVNQILLLTESIMWIMNIKYFKCK